MYGDGAGTRPASGQIVGNIRVLSDVVSPQLGNSRDVHVYLPPSYQHSGRHYPVIYMHDGQNLFDATTSFAGEWHVDETFERISREGVEAIVVAIPNMGPARIDEYSPFHDPRRGGGRGDAYLDFLVDTLKPLVDARFRTRHERTQTGIAGSSLGGLASLYGFFRPPATFGFAGVMSPALWFGNRAIFDVVAAQSKWTGKIYLDIGTGEGRVQVRNTRLMARFLRRTAARPRLNIMYVEDRGAAHHESAWSSRFERAVRFLLPRTPPDLHW
ncbi:MAG: alpha/beta hydrolase-fold protein [Acidobacteria bacterium]|nr:alpha/beta hydrolase-fold protein [Acidobacteriota bacterium]